MLQLLLTKTQLRSGARPSENMHAWVISASLVDTYIIHWLCMYGNRSLRTPASSAPEKITGSMLKSSYFIILTINFCILALGSGQRLLYRLGSGLGLVLVLRCNAVAHTVLHLSQNKDTGHITASLWYWNSRCLFSQIQFVAYKTVTTLKSFQGGHLAVWIAELVGVRSDWHSYVLCPRVRVTRGRNPLYVYLLQYNFSIQVIPYSLKSTKP